MKLNYRLTQICGNIFENGNLCFTPDGNTVISPVGNRVTAFDLVHHSSITLPFENKKNIKRICISNNGRYFITIDIEGHALFINFPRRVILLRHHFKRKVHDIKFSPSDEYFCVTFGRGCQIWKTPNIVHEFSPLTLCRNISGHNDTVVCLDWSLDSNSIVMGSKDLTARVYFSVHSKKMALTTLSGHRDEIVNIFYSSNNNIIYSIAKDGAIFTWIFDIEYNKKELNNDIKNNKNKKLSYKSNNEVDGRMEGTRSGAWKLHAREFLWEPNTSVSSASFNKQTSLLVIGFDQGVYGLYELTESGCTNIQRLSVSHHSLNATCINNTGEWLALGSARLGQLLVWEWKSESYVLKQQGHLYGLSSVDFSDDGQYIVTGGEDSKVKLWNAESGYCFSTFAEHLAPVTGVRFVGKGGGRAVISCSLDGTVRAHDLLRYRNFRTLTTPTPVQFTCVAVDISGELVCAGALDPFNVYVWTLQTGQLLDVLAGHEGPIACLEFFNTSGTVTSGSWDGTLKVWDVYKNLCSETFEHGCDVLAVAVRPDGKEVCTATTNGQLSFWDIETGAQMRVIEGRRDISGGRLTSDLMTSANSARAKCFTCVTYSADGMCVLAAGKSKFVCIYSVLSGTLLKKFTISHNRSLEGIAEELRSDRLVDGVALDALRAQDGDSDNDEHLAVTGLPGAGKGTSKDGSRSTRPDISCSAVRFSASGRQWAVASTQGLQVFSLDEGMVFAPTDLDIAITPQTIAATIARNELGLALNMALHLGEPGVLKRAVDAVSVDAIDLVLRTVDVRMLPTLMRFLATELANSCHLEFYLRWVRALLYTYGDKMQRESTSTSTSSGSMESLRALIRAVSVHDKLILQMTEENQYTLAFLLSQLQMDNSAGAETGDFDEDDTERYSSEAFFSSQGDLSELAMTDVEEAEPDVHPLEDESDAAVAAMPQNGGEGKHKKGKTKRTVTFEDKMVADEVQVVIEKPPGGEKLLEGQEKKKKRRKGFDDDVMNSEVGGDVGQAQTAEAERQGEVVVDDDDKEGEDEAKGLVLAMETTPRPKAGKAKKTKSPLRHAR